MAGELLERQVDALLVQPAERSFEPPVADECSDVPVLGADVQQQRQVRARRPGIDRTLEQVEERALAVAQLRSEQRARLLRREVAAEVAPEVARERAVAAGLSQQLRHPCPRSRRTRTKSEAAPAYPA